MQKRLYANVCRLKDIAAVRVHYRKLTANQRDYTPKYNDVHTFHLGAIWWHRGTYALPGHHTQLILNLTDAEQLADASESQIRVHCRRNADDDKNHHLDTPRALTAYALQRIGQGAMYQASLRDLAAMPKLGGMIAKTQSLWQVLKQLASEWDAEPIARDGGIGVYPRRPATGNARVWLVGEHQQVRGLEIQHPLPKHDDVDGIVVSYTDHEGVEHEVTAGEKIARRPKRVATVGTSTAAHAQQLADLAWRRQQARRWTARFATDLDARNFRRGDRIDLLDIESSSAEERIVEAIEDIETGAGHLILDAPFTVTHATVHLRHVDGSRYTTTAVHTPRGIRLGETVPEWVGSTVEPTVVYCGELLSAVIERVSPDEEDGASVQVIAYDPDCYL